MRPNEQKSWITKVIAGPKTEKFNPEGSLDSSPILPFKIWPILIFGPKFYSVYWKFDVLPFGLIGLSKFGLLL